MGRARRATIGVGVWKRKETADHRDQFDTWEDSNRTREPLHQLNSVAEEGSEELEQNTPLRGPSGKEPETLLTGVNP
ncbi:hypothetical protein NDU88_002037 [Pleurodeles waltl]|uniref:Uncharacterized protein n=1 Tax=Pleurodeles waltl TaxID=8319 RepID=A0AAV7VA27_PLEWA|nr:hypothetical protein NDU88_002037 [Pleurodeles waltl]